MKKKISLLFIFLMLLTVFSPMMKVFALEEGQIELTEIVLECEIQTESLEPGELPAYEVTTTTAHASIEDYGSNTGWAYLENGTWHGFGEETPTAVADGPFYAMRLKVDLSDGYVFTENTKIIYNDRDMIGDTYSSITPFEWGGYVYVDLGQIFGEPGPSVDGNVIHRVNIFVDMPSVGDTITVTDDGERRTQTQYRVDVDENDVEYYGPHGDDTYNYMYILDENTELVEGTLEEKYYDMMIWLIAFDDYVFAKNVEIYVNGDYVDQFNIEDDIVLGIDYVFQPDPPDTTYTLDAEDGKYMVEFVFPEGTDFELTVFDLLQYTPEQIAEMFDVPEDYFAEALEAIKQNTKEYGELLGVYAIEINGPGFNFSGNGEDSIKFRIKLTEEMAKYDTFKFIFLDENNEFVIEEVHDTSIVTIEGVKYIEVSLDHLSAYALVGSNTDNPGTADKVIYYILILVLSTVGFAGLGVYTKKAYFN